MKLSNRGIWPRVAWLVGAVLIAMAAVPVMAQADGPQVRFAHLAVGGDPVDVYLDSARAVEALGFGQTSEYLALAGGVTMTVRPAGSDDSVELLTMPLDFLAGDGGYHTVALVAGGGALMAIPLPPDGVAATGAATAGDLSIGGAFVRATAAGMAGNAGAMGQGQGTMHGQSDHHGGTGGGVTAAYLTIRNGGAADDRLVSARADAAARVEIHETIIENDVARMQMLPDGVLIPAGGSAELRPGGMHLMLMDLSRPLTPGQAVRLTLTFESGAVVVLHAPVRMP